MISFPTLAPQREFVGGLTTCLENCEELLTCNDKSLLKEHYWVACSEVDYKLLLDTSKFLLHLKYFGRYNLGLGYTARSALTHYFTELDQTANLTAERTCGPVYLLAFRLSGCELHSLFLQQKLGLFNRLYV